MGKKGMAKFAGKDSDITDDDSFRFVNPLKGDESPHMVVNDRGLDDREKHEAHRSMHTHVDHNEVAPDIEMDTINTEKDGALLRWHAQERAREVPCPAIVGASDIGSWGTQWLSPDS